MINSNKIKGRMRELNLTQNDVAKTLDIAPATANQKINNVRAMSLDEANAVAKLLNITPDDFGSYFFED